VRLDLDADSIEPHERMRDGSRKHVATLDNNLSCVCNEGVPEVEAFCPPV
jgi:hypothetical protein